MLPAGVSTPYDLHHALHVCIYQLSVLYRMSASRGARKVATCALLLASQATGKPKTANENDVISQPCHVAQSNAKTEPQAVVPRSELAPRSFPNGL